MLFFFHPGSGVMIGSAALLGLTLGARHALEPDHLAAVSAMTIGSRSPWHGAALGVLWGVGHSLALLCLGGLLLCLGKKTPPYVETAIELVTAIAMLWIGLLSLLRRPLARPLDAMGQGNVRATLLQPLPRRMGQRTLLVGFVHGLGGSGALMAFLVVGLRGTLARLLYLLLFSVGSIVAMALLSGLLGWPATRLAAYPRVERALCIAAGLLSVVIGMSYLSRVLSVDSSPVFVRAEGSV